MLLFLFHKNLLGLFTVFFTKSKNNHKKETQKRVTIAPYILLRKTSVFLQSQKKA